MDVQCGQSRKTVIWNMKKHWWRDVVAVCSLEGTLTQTDSMNSLILSTVGGIVGVALHMLNQNRHYWTPPKWLGSSAVCDISLWGQHVNVCICVLICWASFEIKGLCMVLNRNWFRLMPVHTWVPSVSLLLCFCDVFWVLLNSLDFDSEPEWTKRGLNLQVRAVSNRGSHHGGDPGLHWPSAGMVRETCAIQEPSKNSQVCGCVPDSKHWFTTSFLQALRYLVMP